ncbi:DUF4153 domain-containing protein [Sphingomonas soli]|uniref:DUF4153 domain-containing protein n=1 Tax=Sphingomonas soli TaxID=266127 RepID=UPI00082F33DC|nr:DUF4153 domain-containing protein [Sphingomonas soli]
MSESHEIESEAADFSPPWPLRPLLLAGLGLATGLAVHLLIGDLSEDKFSAALLAELAFITVTAGLIGFTIERRYWPAALIFSVVAGAVAAGVVWWNGTPDQWSGGDGWRGVALFLAIAIAAPLFQAAQDRGRPSFPYASVHDHAWTNIVLWGASWAFVGITALLTLLLSELFHLIKLDFLRDLMREDWFWRVLIGAAFGGGLGLLREHDVVVRTLQRVVLTVLSVLAPVLAVGLIVFVLALPFTGLAPLWEAGSATGILLACIIGSLILANSVIGNSAEEERRSPALRYGAMGLGLVMLPLGVIAAIAIGLRIGQYGFTPERLWVLTFVILACAYGLAYLVSLLLGRMEWAAKVRPANLNLAFGTCAVALLLATPLVSFNAIATRDQVARLESGKLTPEQFDWRALAFEFGEPGREALDRLKTSANPKIRALAVEAGKAENRWDVAQEVASPEAVLRKLRVLPTGTALPDGAIEALKKEQCDQDEGCTVLVADPATIAIFRNNCFAAKRDWLCSNVDTYRLADGKWAATSPPAPLALKPEDVRAEAEAQHKAYGAGEVEVREIKRRQVFVGGKPVGEVFE